MPFHYGYWDDPGRPRAANELTLFEWDPVSKQPHFKYAAVKLEKAQDLPPLSQPNETTHEDALAVSEDGPEGRPHLADSIGLLLASEERLICGWDKLRQSSRDARHRPAEPAVCDLVARECGRCAALCG